MVPFVKGTSSRQSGWSAIANPQKALGSFAAWSSGGKPLNVQSLLLARDYAVVHRKGRKVVKALNSDLREAVRNVLIKGEQND
jgi:hypothetical protein